MGVYLQVSNNWIPVIGHLRRSRVNYVHLDEVFLSVFLLPFAKQMDNFDLFTQKKDIQSLFFLEVCSRCD